jgi:hypothetical protein
MGSSGQGVANARRKQSLGRPSQNPPPSRMAGGPLKRQGDVSGDGEDAKSQASETIKIPVVSLLSANSVPLFVGQADPNSPTVRLGHIIQPPAADMQWRAMIDLGLLGPRYDGTPNHMCALNMIALALIPGCAGVSSITPAKLSSAVMCHFKGSTNTIRTDARSAMMRAIMSCGSNFRTPTEDARLSLPTIYE